jgi:hypothetical protein
MSVFRFLVTANVVPSTLILFNLMMEVIRPSETPVLTRATRFHIPEYGLLLSYRREYLARRYALYRHPDVWDLNPKIHYTTKSSLLVFLSFIYPAMSRHLPGSNQCTYVRRCNLHMLTARIPVVVQYCFDVCVNRARNPSELCIMVDSNLTSQPATYQQLLRFFQ